MSQPLMVLTAGAAAFGLAALLWALRVSDGARGAARRYREEAQRLRERLARNESVFAAHPGIVLVWDDEPGPDPRAWGEPSLYGSPVALMGLMRFSDDGASGNPAVRILEGLADLEARDGAGQDATLRERLRQLRADGAPFSLTIIGPSGRFLEADGRTAGARAVLWITDTTIKGLEESGARGRLEEARQVVARDPMAFLEMLGKAPFPAWRMSGAGKLQWVNEAYLAAVGAPSADHALDRQTLLDQAVTSQAQKVVASNAGVEETRHVVVAGGARRALRVLMFPLSGGLGGMALDVTDEEAARASLDKHVRAHDETLNHVADGVAVFGPDRKLIFHNDAFAALWGLDPGYLRERPDHGSLLDRLRERRKLQTRTNYGRWREQELAYYQGEKSDVMEDQWDLPDGRTLKVTRQRHPMGGLLILFKDITTEIKLRSDYNGLINAQSATLDHLREAVAVFGLDGRLRLHNDAFARLWELDEEKLKDGPDFDAVVADCVRLYHDRNVWNAMRERVTNPAPEQRRQDLGVMNTSHDRTITWLTQPLPNSATLIAFMDVTADRRVEQALAERADAFRAADRLKTEFMQHVSRQLRDPLTTMSLCAELLDSQRYGPLAERQRDQVKSIIEAARRLGRLIDDILDISSIEAGRMELELTDVDLRQAIDEAVELIVSTAASTRRKVEVVCDKRIGSIHADRGRIKQILINLLSNAMRFSGQDGQVRVEARRMDGVVQLIVADDGRGIAPDKQVGAFDSFRSGDNNPGLGLSLVRAFVELHGGSVMMKSAPQQGTLVQCFLPETAGPRGRLDELELIPEARATAA